jgi:hypothetical protein
VLQLRLARGCKAWTLPIFMDGRLNPVFVNTTSDSCRDMRSNANYNPIGGLNSQFTKSRPSAAPLRPAGTSQWPVTHTQEVRRSLCAVFVAETLAPPPNRPAGARRLQPLPPGVSRFPQGTRSQQPGSPLPGSKGTML